MNAPTSTNSSTPESPRQPYGHKLVTAIIADDEAHLARYLKEALARVWPELCVLAVARNGPEASAMIAQHKPTLAFLDIKMPGRSGIEVAQGVEDDTQFVFVTAYDEFAVQAFEREAIDYLLKPVGDERLAQCRDRVLRRLGQGAGASAQAASGATTALGPVLDALLARMALGDAPAPASAPLRWIRASRGDTTYQVPVADVLYFEADDKYTSVVVPDAEHLIRVPIAELARSLDPARFWQVHRAFIVNVDAVLSTRREESGRLMLRLRGVERELSVSRAYAHLFRTM